MNIYLLFILGLIIPLVILFVFSIYIIISVLNRKNIKLDLFAFNFRFKKRRNIENAEQVVNTLNQQQAVPQAQAEPIMPVPPVSDATQQESLTAPKSSMQDFPEDTDFQNQHEACLHEALSAVQTPLQIHKVWCGLALNTDISAKALWICRYRGRRLKGQASL